MSAPRILIVGCDKGAWQMRGHQIGAALRATVTSKPKTEHWGSADVIILVKNAAYRWANEARESGARLIWDVLDIWPQPDGNQATIQQWQREIWSTRDAIGISRLIGATLQMAYDICGAYIPHHSHAGLTPTPIRERLEVIGYEGSERYLGAWRPAIEQACQRLGLRFVVNPRDLSEVDLFVAFRDGRWNGLLCRRWKSGVKYVNAIAAGRPTLTQGSAAFFELRAPGQVIERQDELDEAIRAWSSRDRRQAALDQCRELAPRFTLEAIERQYRVLIADVLRRVA